jgi:hypothetical protein
LKTKTYPFEWLDNDGLMVVHVEIIFVRDNSLARFEGINLFPDKVARAKEDFKNVVFPPR